MKIFYLVLSFHQLNSLLKLSIQIACRPEKFISWFKYTHTNRAKSSWIELRRVERTSQVRTNTCSYDKLLCVSLLLFCSCRPLLRSECYFTIRNPIFICSVRRIYCMYIRLYATYSSINKCIRISLHQFSNSSALLIYCTLFKNLMV